MSNNSDGTTGAPLYICHAEEYLLSHAGEDISVSLLSDLTGKSARALYDGFKKYRRTTPMRMLKVERLMRAREDLIQSDPRQHSVTVIATKWGFGHLGRFSLAYKEMYGESPSVTLRDYQKTH